MNKLTGVVGGGGVVNLPPEFLLLLDSGRLVVDTTFVCFGLLELIAFLVGTPLLNFETQSRKNDFRRLIMQLTLTQDCPNMPL